MAEKISKRTANIVIALVILGILIFLFGNRNFRAVIILGERIEGLKKDIEKLKAHNVRLEDELRQIKENPEYFEDLARKKLGMIKPGEKKYKLVSPEGKQEDKK